MSFFVVVDESQGGVARTICSTRERAVTFLEERGVRGRIEELSVAGDYEYPRELFVAHVAREEEGGLQLAGLYADEEEAESVAGGRGQVTRMRPDGKAVEDIH